MLYIVIALLVLAGLLGLVLVNAILKNKSTPKRIVYLHGLFALSAIVLLGYFILMGNNDPLLITSLVLLVSAALGGLTMFFMDVKKHKSVPKVIAIVHPLVAIAGIAALVVYFLYR